MNPTEVYVSLDTAIDINIPVLIWGKPGVGKSQTVQKFADDKKRTLIDQRLSQLDPVDLRGIPYKSDKNFTEWAIPGFLPNVDRDGEEGILFLDEINKAAQSVQAAAYQLILDRRLGDYVLPDGWRIIAAGNNTNDKAFVTKISSALANRFIHIDFEESVSDFVDWGIKNNIDQDILAFIQWRPELLHNMDTSTELKAFPTPRSWEYASKIVQKNPPVLNKLLKGTIGDAATIEFSAFMNIFKSLPTIQQMINDPDAVDLFVDSSIVFAVASLIARNLDAGNIKPLFSIVNRMSVEFQVFVVKTISVRNKALTGTPEVTKWILANPEIFNVGK